MAVRKRTKSSRHRGSHTHGWGSKKKHRGSGNRGGAGMAGTGKRAQSKKPGIWHSRYFGKFERVSLNKKPCVINVGDLESLMLQHNIKQTGGAYTVDLGTLGITRLTGRGMPTQQFHLTVSHASERAQHKILKAQGSVSVAGKEQAATQ